MKLDIEAMARESKMRRAAEQNQEDYWLAYREDLEAFARLIVERCAAIVDTNTDGCQRGSDMRLVLQSNAAAIRSLMGDDK